MPNTIKLSRLSWLIVSVVVIVLDQFTKYLVMQHLTLMQPVKILPFLNFTLYLNTGAAFNFLGGAGGWQIYALSAFSIIVAIGFIIWLLRMRHNQRLLALSVSLIVGGALGNTIDRIRLAHVIDFISLHWHGWYFAIFNVADSAITVGAVFLFVSLVFFDKN